MNRDKRPPLRRMLSRRQMLGAALSTFAFPAMARARGEPPPLGVYGQVPAISKVAISPDGKRVALIRHKADSMWLEDRDLATGQGVSIEINGNMAPSLIWASNDRILLVTSMTSRAVGTTFESWIGMIVDVRQHRHYQLFSEMPDYGPNLNGDFHRVKMRRGYCVTASNTYPTTHNYPYNHATTLYAFSALHFRPDRLDEDSRRIVNWAVRGDGTVAARAEYDEDSRLWQLRFRGRRGWRVIWKKKMDLDLPLLKGMGRTRDKVLVYFNEGEHADSFVEVGEDGVFSEPLARNRVMNTPLFDPVSGLLIGFSHEDGLAQSVRLDKDGPASLQALERIAPLPLCEQVDFAEGSRTSLLYGEGPDTAGAFYAVDLDSEVVTPLGETYPDLPADWMFAKQPISYVAGDGLTIGGFLTRPGPEWGEKPALVVLPHGGPESFDDGRFDYMAQALASRGYQVLQPNFRGSSHMGRDFVARGYGEWGRRMQSDLSDGVAWLVGKGLADPARVAIVGASYGGYAALAGVALQSDIYNCAVSMGGISDIDSYMDDLLQSARQNRNARALIYWRRFLGPEAGWRNLSPVSHAADVTVPVLLIHGRDDAVVEARQSRTMHQALATLGKPAELVLLDDGDHYLSRTVTRVQALEAMVAFLVKHNPPGPVA